MTATPTVDTRPALLGLDFDALVALLAELAEPPFRARQIWTAVHKRFRLRFSEMTELPLLLRAALDTRLRIAPADRVTVQTSDDGSTTKALLRLDDGELIEAVLMRYDPFGSRRARITVCVSTQAGCAMGCVFCATGAQGFRRQLTPAEVLLQVLTMARLADDEGSALTNVVFMGMGEPLANYATTSAALTRLSAADGWGLGPRRITVSTIGVLPGMRRLATDHPQVNLAVSLHAPDEALRRQLVPIPSASLQEIVNAARDHAVATGRRVSFEYVLLAGLNDSPHQARRLASLLKGLRCHVNLIPANPSPGVIGKRPSRRATLAFQATLNQEGIAATVRVEKGRDIAAACGQLRGDRKEARRTGAK